MKKIAVFLCWSCLGCSGDSGFSQNNGGLDGGAVDQGADIYPSSCTSSEQCAGVLVCSPLTGQCTSSFSCQSHADCGKASYCGGDGACAKSVTGSACASDENCTSGETCKAGFCGCEGQSYSATKVSPNVLIVMDRSGSMTGTKWTAAKQAVANLLAAHGQDIRFGLALFPGAVQVCDNTTPLCSPGAVFVDPLENAGQTINGFLNGANTCGNTPTAATLTALKSYAGLKDTTRGNYILLITDGQSNCSADPVPVVAELFNQTPSVKTFAVGFGAGVDPTELNDIATQGGTAIAGGPPYYYVASDATTLAEAFSKIAGAVLSCTYALSTVPQNIEKLFIYQNKVAVARDTTKTNGWDYDAAANQITFYGAACTALQSGQVTDLSIVYGCPPVLE